MPQYGRGKCQVVYDATSSKAHINHVDNRYYNALKPKPIPSAAKTILTAQVWKCHTHIFNTGKCHKGFSQPSHKYNFLYLY